jgi:hypothetical protein
MTAAAMTNASTASFPDCRIRALRAIIVVLWTATYSVLSEG